MSLEFNKEKTTFSRNLEDKTYREMLVAEAEVRQTLRTNNGCFWR